MNTFPDFDWYRACQFIPNSAENWYWGWVQKVEITLIDQKVATAQQQSGRQHFNPAFEGRMPQKQKHSTKNWIIQLWKSWASENYYDKNILNKMTSDTKHNFWGVLSNSSSKKKNFKGFMWYFFMRVINQ